MGVQLGPTGFGIVEITPGEHVDALEPSLDCDVRERCDRP